MNTQSTPAAKTERHLSAEELAKLTVTFGESGRDMAARIRLVDDIVKRGTDVKTMAADLASANRTDDAVPVLSAAMLGYYRFPVTVADLTGETIGTWLKRNPGQVRAVYLAGKRGLKVAGSAVREALKPLKDDVTPAERAEAVTAAAEAITAKVKPVKVSTPRAPKVDDAPKVDGDPVLASIRAAIVALQGGHPYSADIASAISELTAAASTARKRGADAAAQVLTPAAA